MKPIIKFARWIKDNPILLLIFTLIFLGIVQGLPDITQAFIDIFGL